MKDNTYCNKQLSRCGPLRFLIKKRYNLLVIIDVNHILTG